LDKVQSIESMKTALGELHEKLKSDFSNLESGLEAERRTVSQQESEISILAGQITKLETRLHSAEAELEAVKGQFSELQSRHQELVRSSEEALQDLEARYDNDIEVATSKANEEHKHLSDELQDAIYNGTQARNAYEDAQREVSSLRLNIQQINYACAEKDEELEELRTLRSKVLASMGLAAELLPIRNGLRSNSAANDPRTPKQHRRRKSAIQTQDIDPKAPISMQGITNTDMGGVANAPFMSSNSSREGSTPKRAKPRPSFKVPTMHIPNSQAAGYQLRSLKKKSSPSKRSALRQLSPNRRHTTVGFAVPEKDDEDEDEGRDMQGDGKRRGSLGGIGGTMQASFDMDGFFTTSTPFTPGNFTCGTGRGSGEEGATTEL
jgi:polyhydroxyalkanoate synthesis regulator phasin